MGQKILKILSGFNEGAELVLEFGVPLILGNHAGCGLVLVDEHIAPQHCQLLLTEGGVVCTALNGSLVVNGAELHPGETVKVPDMRVVRCGVVSFAVGDPKANWHEINLQDAVNGLLMGATVRRGWLAELTPWRRNLVLTTVVATVVASLGIAYATLLPSSYTSESYLAEARTWLKGVAPAGSELQMSRASDNRLVLSGYVGTDYQGELLSMTVHNSVYQPRIQVFSIEQMVASMSRLVNLDKLSCVVVYVGAGRLGCVNPIENQAKATQLQQLAQQVAGVKALDLQVMPEERKEVAPLVVAQPEEKKVEADMATGTISHFSRKLYILMSKRGRYVIDGDGFKFSEGDVIDGFRLAGIEFDQVQLERNGQRFVVSLGGM